MFPYGAAPEGPIPDRLQKIMSFGEEQVTEAVFTSETIRAKTTLTSIPGGTREKTVEKNIPRASDIYGQNLWSEIEKFTHHVRHLAETHEVDVVHAHDWMTFPAAFEFQRMTGVPVFLHVHATEYDRSGENLNNEVFRIEREGFRRASHIFAVSRYTAGIIERLYGVHRKKISIAYNAPDDAEKGAIAPPTGANLREFKKSPQVIFLGRLTFQKGPDHFLKAAPLVLQARPDAKFILCGTGDMMDKLRAQAHRLGIERSVHFAGFVDPAGVDDILTHSKVLVMPSVSEPFGLVALEAIRCGIPVILSKQSGVREVLHRALQVDFWDHEKLADQIIAALTLPNLSRQLVEEGLDQIQRLSWDSTAEKVIDVYRSYLGSTYLQAVEGAHGH
jgi:glycosyltransferase involved in cell wall biosynthesis